MKLWIDDIRPAPEGYKWIKSVTEFKRILSYLTIRAVDIIEVIDLDHDAGDYVRDGGDYIEILNYLENISMVSNIFKCRIGNISFHIHSRNPVDVENMRRIINKNGWKEFTIQ